MLFSQFTLSVVSASCLISLSRIVAHWKYYHAPLSVTYALEAVEVPRVLNATGHIYLPPPQPLTADGKTRSARRREAEEAGTRVDTSAIAEFGLRLCLGKEWYRFPGHFLVPDGVRVDWVKSAFDGMLPGHFAETPRTAGLVDRVKGTRVVPPCLNDLNKEAPELYVRCSVMLFVICANHVRCDAGGCGRMRLPP